MGGRKAFNAPSFQEDEATLIGIEALTPEDNGNKDTFGEVNSKIGLMKGISAPSTVLPVNQIAKADSGTALSEVFNSSFKENETLEAKPIVHTKRKSSILGSKGKRLRIKNEDVIELKLTWSQAQGLMRPPPAIIPKVSIIEGCEIEEFEHAPVIGRPTIHAIDHYGGKIQWVQCNSCLKWRKVPADALLPSIWTCSENVWGLERSLCSAADTEELTDIIPTISKVSSMKKKKLKQDSDLVMTMDGLDTLANLATHGDDVLPASSLSGLKHPRHKHGCTCIVCLQPPSGKGPKHEQTCDCVVCKSLKRRCKTLRDKREKKQLEKEAETADRKVVLGQPVTEQVPGKDSFVCEPIESKFLASPFKGQFDLNIQPDRDEEVAPCSDSGNVKWLLPDAHGRILGQQGY